MCDYYSKENLKKTGVLTKRGNGFYHYNNKETGEILLLKAKNETQLYDFTECEGRKYLSAKKGK